jgi:glycosyltransferase involved in cell wall biosynthesis
MLSIIIPTKNEGRNIADCIKAVAWAQQAGNAEIIVVDNFSTDSTAAIAADLGARVVQFGSERSFQRNRGGMAEAKGSYLFFIDADMRVKKETLEEILTSINSSSPPDALYVREEMTGTSFLTKVRNFERSFYNATCIDGLRVVKKSLFLELNGFDESLCGPEDWDFDRRLLQKTGNVALTQGALLHNEGNVSLARLIKKKRYYAGDMHAYRQKWKNDAIIRKQLGISYRFFVVFIENGKWKKSLAHPFMLISVWTYKFILCLFLISTLTKSAQDQPAR